MTAPKLNTIRCAGTLYVFDDAGRAKVEAIVAKQIKSGHAATYDDGRRVWEMDEAILDTTKRGADQYTWAKDGNRVLHERVRYTRHKSGKRTREVLRKTYRQP